MSLSLLAISKGWRQRFVWAASAVALLLGVYLTQSRGGFIALAVGLVIWSAIAGGPYRKALLYAPIALIVLVPLTGIGSRLGTLAAITAGSTANADPSVVTRKRLQLDAWHMFLDRPITGHGIGSYGVLFPAYDRLSNYYQPVDIVVAAHNFYLEQAADGGVLLLLGWALFFGTVLFAALRSLSTARRLGDTAARFLSLGVIAGMAGWLVASIFLHLSDFRSLLLLAAIAAANDTQTRRRVAEVIPSRGYARTRPLGKTVFRSLLVVSVLCALGIAAALVTDQTRYINSATLAVVPSSSLIDSSTAYELDVISRGLIVPTFAEVLGRSVTEPDLVRQLGRSGRSAGVSLSFVQSRLGGSIVVTVIGDNAAKVNEFGPAAVTLAKAKVSDLQSGYRLTGVMAGAQPVSSDREWLVVALGVLSLTSAGLAAHTSRQRRSRLGNSPAHVHQFTPRKAESHLVS